jgi:predicted nuclease of predicted toxin-antitoxin system
MFLLIDECCGKALVRVAEDHGHTAQRTTQVRALGRGASDPEIIEFARRHGAVIVTNNSVDFLALSVAGEEHPGMILVPNLVGQELARLFRRALPMAEQALSQGPNIIVQIDEAAGVRSFRLP